MVPQITHLTFDFFGTLVQYKPGHFAGDKKYKKSFAYLQANKYPNNYETFVKEYAEIFNMLTEQSLKTYKEFHMDAVTDIFFNENKLYIPDQIRDAFTKTYLQEWNENVVYFPEIKTFIKRLKKKYSLSIISNTHYSPLVINNVKNMDIESAFDLIVTSVEHGRFKPDSLIFTDTLKSLNTSPEHTIHIGDSYNDDFIGAKNAGMRCILIDSDKKYEGQVKDRVNSLFDIESLL